jgi:hypothetical protein
MTAVLGWLRRRVDREADRREKVALADRLRRELVDYEARLSEAVEALEAATREESNAGLALLGRELNADADPRGLEAARKRSEDARTGRALAGLRFGIARARVNVHSGALFQLDRELAEHDEESRP